MSKKEHLVLLDGPHRSLGRSFHARSNLSSFRVPALPRILALPKRDPDGFAGFAVCENDVADVARLTGNARMHDVPNHVRDSGDAVGSRLQEVHARDHSHLQVVAMVSRDRDRREVSGLGFRAMELAGLEPATSWVRSRRSPN
jgi:hypothetical protein